VTDNYPDKFHRQVAQPLDNFVTAGFDVLQVKVEINELQLRHRL
jgi:hypothetical protein